MIKLFKKTKNNFIENEEISNFITIATKDVTDDEVVSVVLNYRKDSTILKNQIKENRFNLTLSLFEGIENNVDKDNIAKYIVNSSQKTTRNPEL